MPAPTSEPVTAAQTGRAGTAGVVGGKPGACQEGPELAELGGGSRDEHRVVGPVSSGEKKTRRSLCVKVGPAGFLAIGPGTRTLVKAGHGMFGDARRGGPRAPDAVEMFVRYNQGHGFQALVHARKGAAPGAQLSS